jgi:hypothetical protein
MADQKKPVEAASAAPGEQRAVSRPKRAKASESGDPAVHKAIADMETARLNLDAAKREGKADPESEQHAADARAALEELGFE